MPFRNSVVGGVTLVRPAIRSPNFVTGVSGWSIDVDGSAEFNDITIRGGSVISGTSLWYSPSPGAGNLFLSIAAAAGTDAFGNDYPKGLSVGSDATRQIVLDVVGNTAEILFSANTPNANASGALLESIINAGMANEYLTLQAIGPTVDPPDNDDIRLQLNSQNADGSSEANAVISHSAAGELMSWDPARVQANVPLRTVRAAAGNNALQVRVTGDTVSRLLINSDGSLSWGPGGGSSLDTNLYRSAASTLHTDDSLEVDQDLTVDGNLTVGGIGQVQHARRTSDLSRTTSVQSDDPQLQFPVVANAVYALSGWIKYSALEDVDILLDFSTPAGALGEWTGHGAGLSTTAQTTNGYLIRTEANDVAQSRNFAGTTGTTGTLTVLIEGTLRVGANAGTYALQWGQGVTDAGNPTTVYTDSRLRLERIA